MDDASELDDEEEELAPVNPQVADGRPGVGRAVLVAALLALLARAGDRYRAAVPPAAPTSVPDAAAAFGDKMESTLTAAHSWAASIGRQRAGIEGPLSADDRAFAGAAMDLQAPYLARFVEDIRAGRYTDPDTGELRTVAIEARAALYNGMVHATEHRAYVAASPEDARFNWILDDGAAHCADCPELAAGGPYTAAQLDEIGYPGAADTECDGGCRCGIEEAA